jgi:hypothetical protein
MTYHRCAAVPPYWRYGIIAQPQELFAMHQQQCEICGRPATIHDTSIENSVALASRHLCQEHGSNDLHSILSSVAASSQDALSQLSEWYRHLTDVEKRRLEAEYRLMKTAVDQIKL